jgi:hypothetical protein
MLGLGLHQLMKIKWPMGIAFDLSSFDRDCFDVSGQGDKKLASSGPEGE